MLEEGRASNWTVALATLYVTVGMLLAWSAPALAAAPAIDGESVSDVLNTSATLQAQVNPIGEDTHYYFQYGTVSCAAAPASCTDAPAPPGTDLGSAEGDQVASVEVQGLAPSTTYHYRVVASNGVVSVEGADETFTTEPGGGELKLPDGRVWELVSPAQKYGSHTQVESGTPTQAAADGGAVTYNASGPTELEPQGGEAYGVRVFSTRGPSGGWSSLDIQPPYSQAPEVTLGPPPVLENYKLFSADLRYGLLETISEFDPLSPEATERTPYLRADYAGGETSAVCVNSCYRPLVTAANVPPGTAFGGADPRTEVFPPVGVLGATPDLSSVVLSSPVALTQPGSAGGRYVWTAGRLEPVPGAFLAVTDGRVFFAEAGGIYVLDIATGQSRLLASNAAFVMTNGGGAAVFFTSEGHYFRVEVESGRLSDLMPGSEVLIKEVSGHSEDGSYLYFGGVVGGKEGEYVLHEDSPEWTTTLVAETTQVASPVVSRDGRHLAFVSRASLTGYDNEPVASGECTKEIEFGVSEPAPCNEAYEYDADGGRLVCVSCDPTGERPSSDALVPGPELLGYQPRYLSEDGRVFFDSGEALVPQDVNGKQDVYEYEPVGVGGCATSSATFGERSGGCASLISSGTAPEPSTFIDASETGGDVFFMTSARLSSLDVDRSMDVYDAHECTAAAPCYVPPVSPPPCSTSDSCKAAPTPQPTGFGAPSSETFSGAGNLMAPPPPKKVTKKTVKCKKGDVKNKKHKCVKRPKKKKNKAEKSSHGKGRA
jgi:hypothetical protein